MHLVQGRVYMQQGMSVMLVSVKKLRANGLFVPEAFRRYIQDHFEEETMFGKKYMFAFQVASLGSGVKTKGVAPCHTSCLMQYTQGLPDGMNLNQWIENHQNTGLFWQHSGTWEDGQRNSFDDD